MNEAAKTTAKCRLVEDVGFLFREPRHQDGQTHPQEIMNIKEAVQDKEDENNDAEKGTQRHFTPSNFLQPIKTCDRCIYAAVNNFPLFEVTKNQYLTLRPIQNS